MKKRFIESTQPGAGPVLDEAESRVRTQFPQESGGKQ
jgi:hypothetical protein